MRYNGLKNKTIEKIINENYKVSFMNNSKWEKLLNNLTEEFDSIFIRYKLIVGTEIKEVLFNDVDFKPFFIEPILYKEIEWIEFPKSVLYIQNKRISRQVISESQLDIEKIENAINRTGIFEMEKMHGTLRLFGYK